LSHRQVDLRIGNNVFFHYHFYMNAAVAESTSDASGRNGTPPLENGDRLTRQEFERRYEAMIRVKKAELIEGVVYMASPARFRSHGQPHGLMVGWVMNYSVATPGTGFADNGSVRLDADNEPQPDVLLRIEDEFGGTGSIDEEDFLAGPPELIIEVAASSASIDAGIKKQVYRRNGVQEYLLWRVLNEQFDWWGLVDGEYRSLPRDPSGITESKVFPGLRLNIPALLKGNFKAVLDELQKGLKSQAHQEFIAALQLRKKQ
jgi:Uma2 family endonuclease